MKHSWNCTDEEENTFIMDLTDNGKDSKDMK